MRARSGSGKTQAKRPPVQRRKSKALTRDERALLLQACRRYRNTLPLYLQSVRSELTLIRSILKKLG